MHGPAAALADATTPMPPYRPTTSIVLSSTRPGTGRQAARAHTLVGARFRTIERFGVAVARRDELGRHALTRHHEGKQAGQDHAQSTFRTSAMRLGAPTFLRTFAACILTVRLAIERTSPISS